MSRRLVVEADGGSRGNPGEAAYGALVRDGRTGDVLAERAERLGIASNNVAEYRGLVAGLAAAAEIDPHAAVEVRMDSKLVVEQMSGRWKIKHPDMRELALLARDTYDPGRVTYTWVPRIQNAAADRLVNAALDDRLADVLGAAEAAPAVRRVGRNRIIGWSTDLGTPTCVVLMRHGQTEHTAARLFSGRGGADPALSETGLAEAAAAAKVLQARGIDVIVSSPLRRCRETAQVVARVVGLPVGVEDGVAEAAFGEWDGLPLADVTERWGDQLADWLDRDDSAPPGGESMKDVGERVAHAVAKLVRAHQGQTILVVTHTNPIKLLIQRALGAPVDAIYRLELPPASLAEIDYYEEGVVAVRSFGVAAHLAAVPNGL